MKVMIIAAAAALFFLTEVYAVENIQSDERRGTESVAHAFTAFVKASSDLGEAGTLLAGFSVAGGSTKNGSIEH